MNLFDSAENLGSLIRFHRKRAGLTQVGLADLAAVSRKVVQEVEAGKNGVSWGNLTKILEVLNVKLTPEGPLVAAWIAERKSDGS